MELKIDCGNMTDVRKAHDMLGALLGHGVTPASKPNKKVASKPNKKAAGKPDKKAEDTSVAVELEETGVTREELMNHIKKNFADNIQPIKDMLARMGASKVSEIPDDQLAKAMGLLTEG